MQIEKETDEMLREYISQTEDEDLEIRAYASDDCAECCGLAGCLACLNM